MANGKNLSDAPAHGNRGLLLALGAGGLIAAVLAYSGNSWPVVVHQLLSDGLYLALWALGAAGLGSACLLPLARFDADFPRTAILRWVTSVALGLGVISLAALGLGLAGLLNRFTAFGLLAAGVAAGVFVVRLQSRDTLGQAIDEPLRRWLRGAAGWNWLLLVVVPPFALALVGAILPPGMLWHPDEPHGYDVIEYHLQVPREWYEAGRIVPLEHNVFSYFPFNVETHYLLAMHLRGGPWKGMYLAQLMHVAFAALTVVAVYGLASALSKHSARTVLAALATASFPWLTLLAPVAYNEAGLLLYGSLAIGWALLGVEAPTRSALTRFTVAGAMAGFACGVKLTAVPMLLLAVPAALLVASWKTLRFAPVYVLVGTLLFAPWLVRNTVWTGNPVFPQATSVFGRAHFKEVQVERWERAHSPTPAQAGVGARVAALSSQVVASWRFGYVPLAAGLVALGVGIGDRRMRALAALLAMFLLFWLGFTHLQGRFFVLAIPVVALGVGLADWRRALFPATVVFALACAASWALVHQEFARRMYGPVGWAGALGADELSQIMLPPDMDQVPEDANLVLIGDARAFYYQRPMRALRYRTVFDVDTSGALGVMEAWRGGRGRDPGAWEVVHPSDLRRFADTYWGIPPLPDEWKGRKDLVVVPPG